MTDAFDLTDAELAAIRNALRQAIDDNIQESATACPVATDALRKLNRISAATVIPTKYFY